MSDQDKQAAVEEVIEGTISVEPVSTKIAMNDKEIETNISEMLDELKKLMIEQIKNPDYYHTLRGDLTTVSQEEYCQGTVEAHMRMYLNNYAKRSEGEREGTEVNLITSLITKHIFRHAKKVAEYRKEVADNAKDTFKTVMAKVAVEVKKNGKVFTKWEEVSEERRAELIEQAMTSATEKVFPKVKRATKKRAKK
jgi:hypothetical protein